MVSILTPSFSMHGGSILDPLTHIETPENVRLAFHLAGPGSRMGAYLLDLALRWAVLSGLVLFVGLLLPIVVVSGLPVGIYLVGLFLVEWGYGCLFEGLWNGQTPGKRAFHLRVMKEEGYSISFHEAMLRNLLRAADILPFLYGVGFLTMLSNARMQRIGDLVAGTIVVREGRHALREELPGLRTVEPLSPAAFRNAYRPSEHTLDVIEGLFRRESMLGMVRVEEIARILADPLARRLSEPHERREARSRPSHFLFRVLATFQPSITGRNDVTATPPRRPTAPIRAAS
jgi:uncharacterized RDD family membrane protein YckC